MWNTHTSTGDYKYCYRLKVCTNIIYVVGLLNFVLLALGLCLLVYYYKRTNISKLKETLKEQELLYQQNIIAYEKEKNRIAKDLHDQTSAYLNVIHVQTQALKSKSLTPEKLAANIHNLSETTNMAIQETSRIAYELLPPTLEEFGLIETLKEIATTESKRGLNIQLQFTPISFKFKNELVELNLFRILEALIYNNTRTNQVKNISIDFTFNEKNIDIWYVDDGQKELSPEDLLNNKILQKNIESRLNIIGGKWSFQSTPEQPMKAHLSIKI